MLDPATGEVIECRLEHENGEAKKFYATLPSPARVGMEATSDAQWFERMLQEHHHELWIGDTAEIRAAMVRKQKTDSRDALHILDLLLTNRFPRIWVPAAAERDLRQMLRHRSQAGSLSYFSEEPAARTGDGARPLPEEEAVG
jgi:transposase